MSVDGYLSVCLRWPCDDLETFQGCSTVFNLIQPGLAAALSAGEVLKENGWEGEVGNTRRSEEEKKGKVRQVRLERRSELQPPASVVQSADLQTHGWVHLQYSVQPNCSPPTASYFD